MAFIQKNILFGDHSEWGWSAEKKEVNKHPKFDENFDIQHQLEHFEYVMIHALIIKLFISFL